MSLSRISSLCLLVILAAACAPQTPPPVTPAADDTADDAGAAPAAPSDRASRGHAPAVHPAPAPAAAPARPATTPRVAEPPAPTYLVVNVPSGTEIEVELLDTLSSGTSQVGDRFRARLTRDLVADGRRVAAAGAEVQGTVSEVVPLKKFGGQPRIALAFDTLEVASGASVPVSAMLVQEGKKQAGRDAAKIAGGAAAGAVVGHQVDNDKGTEIGALVGGAIGTAVAAKTGKEVEIPAGAKVVVALEGEFQVRLES